MMINITIIIPIYNRIAVTKVGLKKLKLSLNHYLKFGKKKYTFSIIVVDDGSSDQSAYWIENHYPEVIILKGDGNLWWAGSINLGSKHAINKLKSDYNITWNNDILPEIDYCILENELNIASPVDERNKLIKFKWWDKDFIWLKNNIKSFSNIKQFLLDFKL